ncbi:hypothetical protein EHS25_006681 [Saitozyma podzolica]|uniref:NFACT RNA-binding domain-containing protein n=1 Tax=Saitozyma podzolica TaxID=1890683 RepID=A0A427YSG3_9TREE|nr:hypothetical protein EHS25_006681 [Saitozyma podzolica]
MVLFFTSRDPPVTIYMGRDKVENEELLRYGLPTDVWFHVEQVGRVLQAVFGACVPKATRGEPHGEWDKLPPALVNDAAQLVKANSIEGNKRDNVTKTGDMAVGQVSFHSDKKVKRTHVPARDNAIVNRLNKTKVEKEVDHEGDRQARLKEEGRRKKAEALERGRLEQEQKQAWEEQKKQRTYEGMYTEEAFAEREAWSDDEFM